ncbi:hypothetical protein ACJX0J_015200 [Zea mays]
MSDTKEILKDILLSGFCHHSILCDMEGDEKPIQTPAQIVDATIATSPLWHSIIVFPILYPLKKGDILAKIVAGIKEKIDYFGLDIKCQHEFNNMFIIHQYATSKNWQLFMQLNQLIESIQINQVCVHYAHHKVHSSIAHNIIIIDKILLLCFLHLPIKLLSLSDMEGDENPIQTPAWFLSPLNTMVLSDPCPTSLNRSLVGTWISFFIFIDLDMPTSERFQSMPLNAKPCPKDSLYHHVFPFQALETGLSSSKSDMEGDENPIQTPFPVIIGWNFGQITLQSSSKSDMEGDENPIQTPIGWNFGQITLQLLIMSLLPSSFPPFHVPTPHVVILTDWFYMGEEETCECISRDVFRFFTLTGPHAFFLFSLIAYNTSYQMTIDTINLYSPSSLSAKPVTFIAIFYIFLRFLLLVPRNAKLCLLEGEQPCGVCIAAYIKLLDRDRHHLLAC